MKSLIPKPLEFMQLPKPLLHINHASRATSKSSPPIGMLSHSSPNLKFKFTAVSAVAASSSSKSVEAPRDDDVDSESTLLFEVSMKLLLLLLFRN
uniref:Uncharacterized protein n=1 Tax=Rhizophora mucronata TaxID=61149 RepID=A0A2P2J768_RHIMU